MTALSVKYAAAQVGTPDIVLNALTTLVVTMCFQVVMQGSYVLLREPEQLRRLLREWREVRALARRLVNAHWLGGEGL